jgi:hypothetical protein
MAPIRISKRTRTHNNSFSAPHVLGPESGLTGRSSFPISLCRLDESPLIRALIHRISAESAEALMSNGTSRTCHDVRLESGLPKQITVTVPKSAGPQYRSRYRGTQPALYLEYRSSERQGAVLEKMPLAELEKWTGRMRGRFVVPKPGVVVSAAPSSQWILAFRNRQPGPHRGQRDARRSLERGLVSVLGPDRRLAARNPPGIDSAASFLRKSASDATFRSEPVENLRASITEPPRLKWLDAFYRLMTRYRKSAK